MKILVAGAGGYLGSNLVKALKEKGHKVTGMDLRQEALKDLEKHLADTKVADMTKPEQLDGILEGIDVVISTVGLEFMSKNLTYMDVDFGANFNLLKEAQKAGIKKFMYVSVFLPEGSESKPKPEMVEAKMLLEKEIIKSGLEYVIFRPVGYFKDFVNIFLKSAREGKLRLIGDGKTKTNPLHPKDFSEFIADNIKTVNEIKPVGGPETYSYNELGEIAFEAVGTPVKISYSSPGFFKVFMTIMRLFKPLLYPIFQFTLWCMTQDMVGPKTGNESIKKALKDNA